MHERLRRADVERALEGRGPSMSVGGSTSGERDREVTARRRERRSRTSRLTVVDGTVAWPPQSRRADRRVRRAARVVRPSVRTTHRRETRHRTQAYRLAEGLASSILNGA